MLHTREEVIQRAVEEFELLDSLVASLSNEEWERLLPRSEIKDPWTVKDALAHITHWKADVVRSIKRQRLPVEERGLQINAGNHLIYLRWHDQPPHEVLAWHRKVQDDLLEALRNAPEEWFRGKDRNEQWPYDLDGHSAYHRVKDIEWTLKTKQPGDK